jgi:hypothetical protein
MQRFSARRALGVPCSLLIALNLGGGAQPSFVRAIPSDGELSTRRSTPPSCNWVPTARKRRLRKLH